MKIHTSCFISSSTDYKQCPANHRPEIAFIGRSNVGKSSLINALLGRKQLAKVSKKPGKTELINHFLVNDSMYFVDLPGYGWAQVDRAKKIKWEKMLHNYLLYRTNLITIFLLIDSKVAPQTIDLACIYWLYAQSIPFSIILTKSDKKNKMVTQKNHMALVHMLEKKLTPMPPMFLVSTYSKTGIETILAYIQVLISTNLSS